MIKSRLTGRVSSPIETPEVGKVRWSFVLLVCGVLISVSCRCREAAEETLESPGESDASTTASCPDGRSVDPPAELLEPSREVVAHSRHATAAAYYQELMSSYPDSATVRVRGGAGAMHAQPPDPRTAERFYRDALRLHEAGCGLAAGDHWLALEGLGLVALMLDDNPAAAGWFQRAATRWPEIPQTQYNLACAHCRSDDVDACHDAFIRALEAAAAGHFPAFLDTPGTVELFIRISRDDPDLARLRADPRYEAAIVERSSSPPAENPTSGPL